MSLNTAFLDWLAMSSNPIRFNMLATANSMFGISRPRQHSASREKAGRPSCFDICDPVSSFHQVPHAADAMKMTRKLTVESVRSLVQQHISYFPNPLHLQVGCVTLFLALKHVHSTTGVPPQHHLLWSFVFVFFCNLREWRRGTCRSSFNTTSDELSVLWAQRLPHRRRGRRPPLHVKKLTQPRRLSFLSAFGAGLGHDVSKPLLQRHTPQSLGLGELDQPPRALCPGRNESRVLADSCFFWGEPFQNGTRAHERSTSFFGNSVFGASLTTSRCWSWYGCPPRRIGGCPFTEQNDRQLVCIIAKASASTDRSFRVSPCPLGAGSAP